MERCEAAVSSNTAAISSLSARLATLEGGGSSVNTNLDSRINRYLTLPIVIISMLYTSNSSTIICLESELKKPRQD